MSDTTSGRTIEVLSGLKDYFPLGLIFNRLSWQRYALDEVLALPREAPELYRLRVLALGLARHSGFSGVSAGQLRALAVSNEALRYIINLYLKERSFSLSNREIRIAGQSVEIPGLLEAADVFVETHPPAPVLYRQLSSDALRSRAPGALLRPRALTELLLLANQLKNPALWEVRELYDDTELRKRSAYLPAINQLDERLGGEPGQALTGRSLLALLEAPVKHAPTDLAEQIAYISRTWGSLLPPALGDQLLLARDLVREEFRPRSAGPGESQVLSFDGSSGDGDNYHYEEPEAFTADRDWMPEVVMMAKMIYVWLDQLSRQLDRPLQQLDDIPDQELDRLAAQGFNCLWLIGIWERSEASRRIKQIKGNQEAAASAYSLFDYVIASELGGTEALDRLRTRCEARGIRLAADVVPNHTGIDSRWIRQHPHWFVQSPYPPFPTYRFNGPNLSGIPELCIQIEDGYFDHSEAAVVFRHEDYRSGEVRYIYHGNDGTHMPWNDTAQLNFLIPEVREAVIGTLLEVAHTFKVIRFDAAMTLAKKHYQRLWFPQPEFWREVVDRVAAEVPDCLLLAEAFWMMEGYFVRTLGMHRVYNSAFMNMLKKEDNAKYREVIKNILEFDPDILGRFVNFMNNPDEETAAEQFGSGDKYFGVAVLLSTLPGLPMFGHGQLEGRHEKYGMEYRRARWDEPINQAKLDHHEAVIFPLLRRRSLFSGSQHFCLYDFWCGSAVDENVFAFSNQCGDDRALVVYNNRYGDSQGWIRLSVAIREKQSGRKRQLSLSEGLGLEAGTTLYYGFTEQASGLMHLRPSLELAHQGLELNLSAYQSRVFLDFTPLKDEDGSWARLYRHLGNRGVESLEDERKKLLYASLHEAISGVLRPLLEVSSEAPPEDQDLIGTALKQLQLALQELPALSSATVPTVQDLEELPPTAWLLSLLLFERLAGRQDSAAALRDLWRAYLLDYPIGEFLEAPSDLPLCLALLRRIGKGDFSPVEYLALPEVRAFLGCNRYKHVLWFNRERLELLVHAGLTALRELPQTENATEMEVAARLARRVLHRAEASGYQFEVFLQLMGYDSSNREPQEEASR